MNKRNIWLRIGMLGAIMLMVFAGNQLIVFYGEYKNGDDKYERIREEAVVSFPFQDGDEDAANLDGVTNGKEVVKGIDFQTVVKTNNEAVGWILFQEPAEINYPIVQGTDNQEYLERTLDADGHKYGTIFMDYENSPGFTDRNTIIYGHHMANGSMFGQLPKYQDSGFWQRYPYFYIFTPDGTELGRQWTYKIFAVERASDGSASFQMQFQNDKDFMSYITYIKQNSLYQTDTDVEENGRIVTLSTCSGGVASERFLVHGVLVR